MPRLILIRHGESEWNRDNRFTGWADVCLTARGQEQMRSAGDLMRREGLMIDVAFTSVLSRCIRSQWALLEGLDRVWVPVVLDWRLNERHYGALTGLSKQAAIDTYGAAQVLQWRRSFATPPPLGMGDGDGHPIVDERYAHLRPEEIPQGESLAQVVKRVRSAWDGPIADALRAGRRMAVTAHGNSLRALIQLIEGTSDDEIAQLEVPNAVPIVVELDAARRVLSRRFLGSATAPASEIL